MSGTVWTVIGVVFAIVWIVIIIEAFDKSSDGNKR